jgi:hypothetical protein
MYGARIGSETSYFVEGCVARTLGTATTRFCPTWTISIKPNIQGEKLSYSKDLISNGTTNRSIVHVLILFKFVVNKLFYQYTKKKTQCVFNSDHGNPNVSGGNPQTRPASETSATEQ